MSRVGDRGTVIVNDESVFNRLSYGASCAEELPDGEYRVIVTDGFGDYETGPRLIGILENDANNIGTVYFSGYAFTPDKAQKRLTGPETARVNEARLERQKRIAELRAEVGG